MKRLLLFVAAPPVTVAALLILSQVIRPALDAASYPVGCVLVAGIVLAAGIGGAALADRARREL